jgi:S1-C subfamily serine protease
MREMAGTNLMNKLTSLLATVLLLGASPALAGPSPAMSTPELVAATKPAIVLITTYDANGQAKGEGTGFVISTDISRAGLGRVVTNAHIIKDASVIRLTNLTGHDYVFHGILGYDDQVDLAILFVQSPEHRPLASLHLADSKWKESSSTSLAGSRSTNESRKFGSMHQSRPVFV